MDNIKLENFSNDDIAITINEKMKGIEIRFANKMTEAQLNSIREAGFRWS